MISKNLYVLTPVEQQELSLVDTTLSQAWQIYERNMPLLEALYEDEEYSGGVGCPHCCEGLRCHETKCKWLAAHEKLGPFKFPCCQQGFGGVRHGEVGLAVGYGSFDEDLQRIHPDSFYYTQLFIKTETFLLGHIEWAQRLIDGEMPVVEETVDGQVNCEMNISYEETKEP